MRRRMRRGMRRGMRWCPPSSDSQAPASDGERWRAMAIEDHRRGVVDAVGQRRGSLKAVDDAVERVVDRPRRSSMERRSNLDRASVGIDIALAKGKALRRRITRSMLAHAARRRARRCRYAMRAATSRRLSSPSMRSSFVSRRRCRAVPRCAAMTPRRAVTSDPATRATDLQCMPQSLVTCGFPASMRVLPRVVVAPVRGLAKGRRERRGEVRAQRSRTASSAYR